MSSPEHIRAARVRARANGYCSACCCRKTTDGFLVCSECRERIRERSKLYRASAVKAQAVSHAGSSKWAALDYSTERCRCGLLLPCENCIPEHADPWQRKGGPSYPEPGGCTFTRAEKAHMGKVESKFIRFTNAKRDAARGAR